jgi:hypothetical protein
LFRNSPLKSFRISSDCHRLNAQSSVTFSSIIIATTDHGLLSFPPIASYILRSMLRIRCTVMINRFSVFYYSYSTSNTKDPQEKTIILCSVSIFRMIVSSLQHAVSLIRYSSTRPYLSFIRRKIHSSSADHQIHTTYIHTYAYNVPFSCIIS